MNTQVLVVGGTTGGIAAGVQSARMGVKTVIVEETNWLGGMLTAAGVSCTDGNDELPSGMWQEFREALYKHYRTRNLFTGWVSKTCFEPHVGDSIFKAWAKREKKLSVHYGWYFEHVLKKGKAVAGAVFKNKNGDSLTVHARITIDATDLGDVFADAGSEYDVGMEDASYSEGNMAPGKNALLQDLTWAAIVQMHGRGSDRTIQRPEGYDSTQFYCCNSEAPCGHIAISKVSALQMLDYGKLPDNKFMINWPTRGNDYYANVLSVKPILRGVALQPARLKTLGFIYFMQTQLGFKNIGLAESEFDTADKLAMVPYHREGRRLRGVVRLNVNHLINPYLQKQKLYRTGISVGDYPIDHHHMPEINAPKIDFPKIPSFNVPLGALIPKDVNGLIVCDKGISVSNIVNGTTRLQPCVLLTGQAAGVLAAKSVLDRKQPAKSNVKEIQHLLLQRKSFIMPYIDINVDDANWAAAQRVGATGLMRGTGKSEGWANKTYFYPDSSVECRELADALVEWGTEFRFHRDHKLTVREAIEISKSLYKSSPYRLKHHRAVTKYDSGFGTQTFWVNTLHLSHYELGRPIKRIELAALLDYVITNLLNIQVSMKGEISVLATSQ
ncbi:MAG: FAD-dependent oxidoreductase [Flammeovirgaceae bacterium]